MNFYKISIGILTLFYALYIFNYPPSFYNDDALFLSNGVENYSIIDFSPHFPGYPFIILFTKFINLFINDSVFSLFIFTSFCAILLPLIIFLYVKELRDERRAFIAFLLSLTSPYLVNLSLSMLSDSVGLFFLFLGLYLFEKNRDKTSAVIFAIAFFSRPSYLIFFIVGFIYIFIFKKKRVKTLLLYFLLTTLFFLVYIFITNGMLFLYEAKRFIVGHFSLWGTGQNTNLTWFENIFCLINLPFVLLIYAFYKFEKKLVLLYILFFSYLLWILFAQNPDNIRHLIPLIFFSIVFISKTLEKQKVLPLLIICFNIYSILLFNQKLSPIDQIIKEIDEQNRVIISNRSIEILRNSLENRVFDHYYINSSKYLMENKKIYLISTIKPLTKYFKEFKGRFVGEQSFYLSKN